MIGGSLVFVSAFVHMTANDTEADPEDYSVANPMAKLTVPRGLLSQTDRIRDSIVHSKICFEANVRYL